VGEGAFLNLRGRSSEPLDGSDMLASVRIWAVKGKVYSVTRRPLLATDTVRQEVEKGTIGDPGDLITAFATAITGDMDPDVANLGDELDGCEEQLDERRVFQLRRTVSRVRVAAIGYRRFLNPQRAALEKLAALPGDWLAADDRLHLSAAADRAARMAEELESIRERSALIHETLSDMRAEQIDNRALVISIVAMVFLPLTFITGLYGMNVKNLPYAEEPWAFDAILGGCTLIAAGIVIYFVQKHWFRQ
jgi:zinc transporter